MVDSSASYATQFDGIQQTAKALSDAYEKANPKCTIKFKEVDVGYRAQPYKPKWTSAWSNRSCARCGGGGLKETKIFAGCGMDGDAYGSYVSYCTRCGLLDWTYYDEA